MKRLFLLEAVYHRIANLIASDPRIAEDEREQLLEWIGNVSEEREFRR